jgi:hypothetical protein
VLRKGASTAALLWGRGRSFHVILAQAQAQAQACSLGRLLIVPRIQCNGRGEKAQQGHEFGVVW